MKSRYKGNCVYRLFGVLFALMNLFVRLSGDLPSVRKAFSGTWWHFLCTHSDETGSRGLFG